MKQLKNLCPVAPTPPVPINYSNPAPVYVTVKTDCASKMMLKVASTKNCGKDLKC